MKRGRLLPGPHARPRFRGTATYSRAAGHAALAALPAWLFILALREALGLEAFQLPFTGVIILVLAGLARTLAAEMAPRVFRPLVGEPYDRREILDAAAVLAGVLVTFYAAGLTGLGPVTAAGLAGLSGGLFAPRRAVPFYCGAFAGMACPEVFRSFPMILSAGLLTGLFYIVAGRSLAGYGGRLGAIAFGGTLAAAYLTGGVLATLPIPGWAFFPPLLFVSLLAASLTRILNFRAGLGPVKASGLVGLAGGLLLPALVPRGEMLAVAAICASFVGMSSRERLRDRRELCLAGLFCGLVFFLSIPCFGGSGGKLGAVAFGSVMATRGIFDTVARLARLRSRPQRRPGLPGRHQIPGRSGRFGAARVSLPEVNNEERIEAAGRA